ncbi:collagen alpha-6(VI) chain [Menidia menidia]
MAWTHGALLCLVAAVCFHGNGAQRADTSPSECSRANLADIVFLVDSSTSIGLSNFQEIKKFLRTVISSLNIGKDQVQVGLAQYSDRTFQEFLLRDFGDRQALLERVDRLQYRTGNTLTGAAIDFLRSQYFTAAAGSRAADARVPQIAVIITDGESQDEVQRPAEELRRLGVLLLGIAVGQASLRQLETIVTHQSDLYRITDYQALQTLTAKVLTTVCTTIEDRQEVLATPFADIFFLVDSRADSQLVRTLLIRLANQVDFGASSYRLGVAQYGEDVKVDFYLDTHKTKEQVQAALRRFRMRRPPPDEPRNLGAALRYARTELLAAARGGRAALGYRQYLVVLSTKDSEDPVYRESRLIKASGATVVGMSLGASMRELRLVASAGYAYESTAINVPTLKTIFEKNEPETIQTEDCKAANVADIVFIVDQSGSIGVPNFQMVRTFLYSVVNSLEISSTQVQVGIVLYESKPTPLAYLNSFGNKKDLLDFIKALPYRGGGTNTGMALQFARENVFIRERGSRRDKGVQQVAVIITDGESQDKVGKAAADLRRAGVTVYSVGVRNADQAELREMASYPASQHVFFVDSFGLLKTLQQSLNRVICTNILTKVVGKKVTKKKNKQACEQTEETEIYFLIDESGTIEAEEFEDIKTFTKNVVDAFRVGPDHVRVGAVKYATDTKLEFNLTRYNDKESVKKAVDRFKREGDLTYTANALTYMMDLFQEGRKSRGHRVKEILVVLTDGKANDDVNNPAKMLRDQGIIIYAIGVREANENELLEISGDPARMFYVKSFDKLEEIKNKVITDACRNDTCKDVPGDLLFVIENSNSIDPANYDTMKDFLKSVARRISVGPEGVHFGVVQFSNAIKLEFKLDDYYTAEELQDAIDGFQQSGEGTATGEALRQAIQYYDAANGGRPSLRKSLVLITDGEAEDDITGPAKALRDKGVALYAIGLGNSNTNQLLDITMKEERVYFARDFNALKDMEDKMLLDLCDPKRDCKKAEKADILFLVDGSNSVSDPNFTSMKNFMEGLVNFTTVGKDESHFGLMLFAKDAYLRFTLDQYSTKQQVLKAVRDLKRPNGDEGTATNTHIALDEILQYFGAQHGGRKEQNVSQILLVITDGEATVPDRLPEPSQALRNNGVTVISVGVEKAKYDELLIIAGNQRDKVFYVSNFDDLKNTFKNITDILCNQTKPACAKKKADLVILTHKSTNLNVRDYTLLKNFSSELAKSFNIGKDSWQVGLAQINTDLQREFYLNRYYTDKELSDHIMGMREPPTDRKKNIGVALRSVREYFEVSRGGRKAADVPKNVLLITDGDSDDPVADAAEALRGQKVEVFGLGIGNKRSLQLRTITNDDDMIEIVESYDDLLAKKNEVVKMICEHSKSADRADCTIDIVIGFDITQRSRGTIRDQVPYLSDVLRHIAVVPDLCCVEPVTPKIGFRVLRSDGSVLDDLGLENYSPETAAKVLDIALTQEMRFNSAMMRSYGDKFRSQSRAGVKVLIIFSDGLDQDVMQLEEEADALRRNGIHALLTVALEGAQKPKELQMVQFGRGFGHRDPLKITMPSVGRAILKEIDAVADRECCNVTCKCTGTPGDRGRRGSPGEKGLPGLKGYAGFPGDEGVPGERGQPGPQGPQGIQGCPGLRGEKGVRGLGGNKGEDGEDGVDGLSGEQGEAGRNGTLWRARTPWKPGKKNFMISPAQHGSGSPRDQVSSSRSGGESRVSAAQSAGSKGDRGDSGLPGEPGVDGRPGPSGADGNQREQQSEAACASLQGSPGGIGEPGPSGVQGMPGPQGPSGRPGGSGQPGRGGSNGRKGEQGDPGVKGSLGPRGPRGMPGPDGRDGFGGDGFKGSKGDPGFPGYPGPPGDGGSLGTSGLPGRKGNRGRGGNSGRSGEDGESGEPGGPGHKGPRGPPGDREKTECELITYIRDNCVCSCGRSCPAYPTELVFGLDMSNGVSAEDFEQQRSILLSLLENITLAESNCPTGARVAVVSFNSATKILVRFQEYRRRDKLVEAVKNIALERTSSGRQLGAAMRYVGQHIFKRTRAGQLMRRVAVYFTAGNSEDPTNMVAAVMEYRAFGVVPAVIALNDAPSVREAFQVDDSGNSFFTRLSNNPARDLLRIRSCAICYDPCSPSDLCPNREEPAPQQLDLDLVLVLDGSREMQADEYAGARQLLASVVQQLAVGPQPGRPRVALVQQGPAQTPKVEFGLQAYQSQEQIRAHLLQKTRQFSGSSVLGRTLDYSLSELLLKASQRRRRSAMLAVVASRTDAADQALLRYASQKALCEGVALFVVAVSGRYNRTQVEELASPPLQQHLLHLQHLRAAEQGYAQRFFRVFLSALNKGVNRYPPPSLRRTCDELKQTNVERLYGGQGQGSITGQEDYEEEQEEEEEEDYGYQEQTGGQTSQMDVTENLARGDNQRPETRGSFNALCQLESDSGTTCADYVQVWFFDQRLGACSPFWYGGCGGNANRFSTEHECFYTCGLQRREALQRTQSADSPSREACFLPQDQGGCQDYVMMWFFDVQQSECARFWYGGCGGNKNRFSTEEQCQNLCLPRSR